MGKLFSFLKAKQPSVTLPTLQENTLWLTNDGYDEIDDDWCLEFGYSDIQLNQFHTLVSRLIDDGFLVDDARKEAIKRLMS